MRIIGLGFIAASLALGGCLVEVHPTLLCSNDEPCDGTEYCDFPDGRSCGRGGALGLCFSRPEQCPDYADPVCGCDGRSYENPCAAHAAGVDVARDGRCDDPCAAQDANGVGLCTVFLGWYWNGYECRGEAGCYCEGVDCGQSYDSLDACVAAHTSCLAPDPCGDGIECDSVAWCDFPDESMCGAGSTGGVCRPRPAVCPGLFAPVCGCDGVTHPNACVANAMGTDVAYDGACSVDRICGGFAGFVCAPAEWCDFPPAAICGAVDQTGVCRARPEACIEIYDPVCGCDGVTHANACLASAAGTDVAYEGRCAVGGECRGLAPSACALTEWCDVLDGSSCNASGTCRTRPDVCPLYLAPACGCDGTTYDNPCLAQAAGTDVAYEGACSPTDDCRIAGCESTASCRSCTAAGAAVWTCVPDGEMC